MIGALLETLGAGIVALSVVAGLAVGVMWVCNLVFMAYRRVHGMSVILRAMRAWHEAHPEGDDKREGA